MKEAFLASNAKVQRVQNTMFYKSLVMYPGESTHRVPLFEQQRDLITMALARVRYGVVKLTHPPYFPGVSPSNAATILNSLDIILPTD